MAYKLVLGYDGIKFGDAFIPNSPGNSDWQNYLAFLDGGGVPEAADPAAPPSVSQAAAAGAKQWLTDNPTTLQLLTLSLAELETEISNHVALLFPLATAAVKARETKIRMAQLAAIRVLVKRELSERARGAWPIAALTLLWSHRDKSPTG